MTGGGPGDIELSEDLIGVASARLLAAGLPRGHRLRALRLLGVLATVADHKRRVRRPLRELAAEFDLPPDEVEDWLDDLLAVGVVSRELGGLYLGGVEPPRTNALRLQDFLAAAAELDERRRPSVRHLRPAGALLVAAAILFAVLVAPGVVSNRVTPASSNGDIDVPAATTTTAAARPATPRSTTTVTTAPARLGPVLVPPTTTTTLLDCPIGLPGLEVLGTTTAADGRLAIEGIARNPTAAELAVLSFELTTTVAGELVTGPGTDRPLVIPAHSSVLWEARLPIVAPAGTLVKATLGAWEWRSPKVAATCPTP